MQRRAREYLCAALCSRQVAAPALPDGGRSVFVRLRRQRRRAPHRMEQSSIPARRRQSVPHSRVREALLAPGGSSGSAGCGAELLHAHAMRKRKSSAPHGAELPSPTRRQQSVPHSGVREALLAPGGGSGSAGWGAERLHAAATPKTKSSAPHGAELHPRKAAAKRAALRVRDDLLAPGCGTEGLHALAPHSCAACGSAAA
jgi:hypothetical protein